VNLPDRTSTAYSVCGNKNAVVPQRQACPTAEAQLGFRQDMAGLCRSVYSFTPSLLSGTLPLPIPFSRGKKLGKQAMRKEELGRTEGKKKHYGSKTTHHLSSYPSSFLSQDAACFIPTLVPLPALWPPQPQSLEPTVVSIPVFSTASWYPLPSFHFINLLLLPSLLCSPGGIPAEPFSALEPFQSFLLPWESMTFKHLEGGSSVNSITSGNGGKLEKIR